MGFSLVTQVLAPAASYNLTDLVTVKDELGIAANDTSNDVWLARAIRQVSSAIATYTKRVLVPEHVQDVFDIQQDPYPYQTPGGFALLELARWPVLGVSAVAQTIAKGTTQALTEGTDFRVDPDSGQLLRLNSFTGVGGAWEAIPVAVTYMAGYGAVIVEDQAVPGTGPYLVTVSQAAAFSCDQSVTYADGTALARVSANPAAGQYSVAAGVYTFNAADAGRSMSLSYGAAAIPDDLVDIALRLITARYAAKGRDPSLVQQETPGVGVQRFWFGGAPGQKGPFAPDIEGALEPYCMPVVA